jgi:hypothetical protein
LEAGNEMSDVLERARARKQVAEAILSDLDLLEKWRRFGRPVVVGAAAFDLVVDPDVDMEIYCPRLKIEHGFEVLAECALNARVTKARFSNELAGRDKALYWQLRYRGDDGADWKIDMWSAPEDYDLPRGEDFVEAMERTLTGETRRVILELKERRLRDAGITCASVHLYRAVLEDHVRSLDELCAWLKTQETGALTQWKPQGKGAGSDGIGTG